MQFDEECVCSVTKQLCEKTARGNKNGHSIYLVEAARLRCDRILSKIFSPARLSSGVDAAVAPPPSITPTTSTAAATNNVLNQRKNVIISVGNAQGKAKLSVTPRSSSFVSARKSPKRRRTSQEDASAKTSSRSSMMDKRSRAFVKQINSALKQINSLSAQNNDQVLVKFVMNLVKILNSCCTLKSFKKILSTINVASSKTSKMSKSAGLSDGVLCMLCEHLFATAKWSFQSCCTFVERLMLPQLSAFTQPCSRSFFNAVVVLTHSYPTAVVTALAAPALRRPNAGSAQAEMVTRLVRDHLPTEARVMLVNQICQNSTPGGWTEAVLGVMQSLLRMKLPLSQGTMASLVQTLETLSRSTGPNFEPAVKCDTHTKIAASKSASISTSPRKQSVRAAPDLTSSLKFSAVLCTLVRQYPPHLVKPHVTLLRQALKRCKTFMAKPALRSLDRLEQSPDVGN